MITKKFPSETYPSDVHQIDLDDRSFLLVGTAHISQESVDLVKRVIENEQPDCVCVELDEKRYASLTQKKQWQSKDLKEIIRNKQLSTLIVNLLMSSFQKKLGSQLGVKPGAELLAACKSAENLKIPLALCDRDVRITLRRAWKSASFFKKNLLLATLFGSLFDKTEISEEKLSELKEKDVLSELMNEFGENLPEVKKVLIDERDMYLAEKIKACQGNSVVAVVGAGHVPGMLKIFSQDNESELEKISTIPPVSKVWKIIGWSVPVLILGSIATIGVQKGLSDAGANLMFWIIANGIPTAIGAIIALAHPLTTIGAFAAAPITSLTPVIGAGYVAAFIQVMTKPPLVREFETVGEEIGTFTGWWKNKLLRVFLVFLLTGIGSAIGTWIGGYEIVKNLLS